MRAILIDPFEEKVEELQLKMDSEYRAIGKALALASRPFTMIQLDKFDAIFLDDEGLFQPKQRFWRLSVYPSPLAGKGLILGTTPSGDCKDAIAPLEAVKAAVLWCPDLRFAGMEVREEQGTMFGKPATIMRQEAKFFSVKELQ